MRWGSAVSVRESAVDAVSEAAEAAAHGLDGATPDLAFVFLSGYGAAGEAQAAERLPALTGSERALGCTSGGVVGGGQEIERKRAVSVTLATLPGVGVRTFHVSADALPDEDAAPRDWADLIGVPPDAEPSFVLVSDAVGVAGPRLVEGLDFAYPASPKVGGLESGGRPPGRGRLFLGGRFEAAGAVGVALTGDVIMATAVAQGARPFGAAGVVTRAERHFVHTIDRAPALEFVRTQLATLDEDDQRRPLGAVCVGLEADPLDAVSPDTGDWLIRNLLGADEDGGAVAVGDEVHSGRRLRLHLRDAAASAADLRAVLRKAVQGAAPAAGALLFSCLGRGSAFYGEADHDSRVFRELAGDVPLGGFFCAGEIGPVGARTYLHGYTSSFALFRPKGG